MRDWEAAEPRPHTYPAPLGAPTGTLATSSGVRGGTGPQGSSSPGGAGGDSQPASSPG